MIYKVITDDYYFWNWLKHSDSYSNNFSLEGAKAVQAWFEELSEDTDVEDANGNKLGIEFDPVAWCCEFSEYDSVKEAYAELSNDVIDTSLATKGLSKDEARQINVEAWLHDQQFEYFQDNTTVIELDNGHIILGEF
jgi:hypothetical protein